MAGIYFREIDQNSRKSQKLVPAKISTLKVVEITANNEEKHIREFLDSSWQGLKRLFVLAYNNKIIIKKVMIKFLLILIKNIFFQELK